MIDDVRRLGDLTCEDFEAHPVWELALDLEHVEENLVRPVVDLPVHSLECRIVGAKVRLANGTRMWGMIENIDLDDGYKTRHFLGLTLMPNGKRIFLARYFDFNQEGFGPAATARALGLTIDQVFPISYDVSNCCIGDPQSISGTIESTPKEKLGQDERLDLIFKKKAAI